MHQDEKISSASSNLTIPNNAGVKRDSSSYCNKCGELKAQPPPRTRYDHHGKKIPTPSSGEHRPPLFDRAKFINSLDLAAAIIGTFTIGSEEFLSEAFPKLFPSANGKNGGSNYVPTLVLHGQKGLYLEEQEKEKVMDAIKTRVANQNQKKKEEVQHLRGGGSSQSSELSKSPSKLLPNTVDDTIDNDEQCNETKEKRSFLTFEGAKVRLPDTPKRKRKGRKRVRYQEEESIAVMSKVESKQPEQVNSMEVKIDSDNNNATVGQVPSPVLSLQNESKKPEEVQSTCAKLDNNIVNTKVDQAPSPVLSLHKQEETKPSPIIKSSLKATIPIASTTSSLPSAPPAQNSAKSQTGPVYSDYYDSSQDNIEELANRARWSTIQPTALFGGEVFFTKVFPGWVRSPEKFKGESQMKCVVPEEMASAAGLDMEEGNAEYSDDEERACEEKFDDMMNEKQQSNNPDLKKELGVHHPKFFLLFEKCGSIVVIISTSNLTPQNALDGSWIQRFDARHESQYGQFDPNDVDLGMPSDFGTILTDFLMKQSDATAVGSMLPDIFLRRYVKGLSLAELPRRYKFEDAHVHLVSTIPGHQRGSIPPRGLDCTFSTYKPNITYGPQRVSFILSRLMNPYHMQLANNSKKSRKSVGPMWIPKALWPAMGQLVSQPTSLGGNWTRESMEEVVAKYLQKDLDEEKKNDLLEEFDIIWPSMDFFINMKKERDALWKENQHTQAATVISNRMKAEKKKPKRERLHVFLSSDSFADLDKSVMSRMSLFETSLPLQMPFTSSSLHIKSVYRLLDFDDNQKTTASSSCTKAKEYFSWFMLTSACLSKGAQGKATPRRGPEEQDEMSYSNFELGVLFCSRLQEYETDRLYVYEPQLKGCQCSSKDKNHKRRLRKSTPTNPLFLDSVRKVHLPVPFKTRAKSYQTEECYDFFSATPYFHEITDGTKGNLKLTPFGQKLASESNTKL